MNSVLDWLFWFAGIVAIPVPVAAVIMCTQMAPRPLFRRLAVSRLLRHWSIVLVVAGSAIAGAWIWASLHAKYHALD